MPDTVLKLRSVRLSNGQPINFECEDKGEMVPSFDRAHVRERAVTSRFKIIDPVLSAEWYVQTFITTNKPNWEKINRQRARADRLGLIDHDIDPDRVVFVDGELAGLYVAIGGYQDA